MQPSRRNSKRTPSRADLALSSAHQVQAQEQRLESKPFDFAKVKVIVKRGKLPDHVLYLDKRWTLENLEHFKPVIQGVSDDEGIEITLTCNLEAFQFILKYLQELDEEKREKIAEEITHTNVLNIMVTADFLKLPNVYETVWNDYFWPQFNSIIDTCRLDLSSISTRVTQDVADRIPLEYLLLLKERSDKFISNVFRHRIDLLLAKTTFYQCKVCLRILTREQARLVSCTGYRGHAHGESNESCAPPESDSYITANGEWFTRHALQANQVDKVALMRFLRDDKRICWLEIYLKVFASSQPPLQCADCYQFYTLSTSGLCFSHPQRSEYQRLRGIR